MYLRARQYGISYLLQEASVFRKLNRGGEYPRGTGSAGRSPGMSAGADGEIESIS